MTETLGLQLEQLLDHALGRGLSRLREQSRMTLEVLAHRSGLPTEELADHESGALPLPISRALLLMPLLNRRLPDLLQAAQLVSRAAVGSETTSRDF